ncbi:MAG: serine acetyltransferase [Proteobacteria bacterium]|nr:MAG: serine acetyltransferase [Pseudomonadota bacterium]
MNRPFDDAEGPSSRGDTPTHDDEVDQEADAKRWNLSAVVERLCDRDCQLVRRSDRLPCAQPLPSTDVVREITEKLRSVLFPGYFGCSELHPARRHYYLGHTLDDIERTLERQLRRGMAFTCSETTCSHRCEDEARDVTTAFLARLPTIQQLVATDVQAAYEGDPALTCPGEAIFCYPGIHAVTNYRLAHELHVLGAPLLPRMITEHAHSVTGIDIHPGATIGEAFFMDHGTGIVIGETSVIGKRVRIYQGVTLGAKSFPLDHDGKPIKGIPRHPIIEDDVCIYSGATILGRVTIGRGAIIGGNVWLTRSVSPGGRITTQAPRRERFEHGGGI